MTLKDLFATYTTTDFNKPIPAIAKGLGINGMVEYFGNEALRSELKQCQNLNQMINVIEQRTGAISMERTQQDIDNFKPKFDQLLIMARL